MESLQCLQHEKKLSPARMDLVGHGMCFCVSWSQGLERDQELDCLFQWFVILDMWEWEQGHGVMEHEV